MLLWLFPEIHIPRLIIVFPTCILKMNILWAYSSTDTPKCSLYPPIISPINFPTWMPVQKILSQKKQYPNTSQYIHHNIYIYTGWWFGTFFIFHKIWDNPSHWLIFFKMVKTTNQYIYIQMLDTPKISMRFQWGLTRPDFIIQMASR